MRYRRISYAYAEVVGGLSRAFDADAWSLLRPRPLASPLFRPPADVVETADAYHVLVDLPGVADDDMDVFVHPDALVVAGRRRSPAIEGAHYHTAEIRYGAFRFHMVMPEDADADRVDATSDRGVLRLVVAKRTGGVA